VVEWIDSSDLSPLVATPLKTAIEAAGDNPELLEGVIEQIKAVAGL